MNNHYNKSLKKCAQELRSETVSKAERYIWKSLLSRKKWVLLSNDKGQSITLL